MKPLYCVSRGFAVVAASKLDGAPREQAGNHQQPVAARPPGRLVQECSTQQVTGRPALVGDATSRLELFLVGTQSCLPLVGDTLALIDSIRPIAEHIF